VDSSLDVARRALPAALAGAVAFVVACALPQIGLLQHGQSADVALYQHYGDQILSGRIPYRTFFVEYPPASLLVFALPSLLPAGDYTSAFQVLMAACALGGIGAVAMILSLCSVSRTYLWAGTLFTALSPLVMGRTYLDRYDAFPIFLLLAALLAMGLGRERFGLVTLGAGTCAKVFPIVALPLFLLRMSLRGPGMIRRGLVTFGVTCVVILLPFVILGPGGARFTTKIALIRPTQIESLGGSIAFAANRAGILHVTTHDSYGSKNVFGTGVWAISLLSAILLGGALLLTWHAFARSERSYPRLAAATFASVAAFIAFGKVLSPQYLIWLVPLAPLALGRRSAILSCSLLVGALGLTRHWFPGKFSELGHLGTENWVVLARNGVLVALFVVAYLSVRAGRYQITKSPETVRR
jgi:hypothetical protein